VRAVRQLRTHSRAEFVDTARCRRCRGQKWLIVFQPGFAIFTLAERTTLFDILTETASGLRFAADGRNFALMGWAIVPRFNPICGNL